MPPAALRSLRAVAVNIAIMRTFVRIRQTLETNEEPARKVAGHDQKIDFLFELEVRSSRPHCWREPWPGRSAASRSAFSRVGIPSCRPVSLLHYGAAVNHAPRGQQVLDGFQALAGVLLRRSEAANLILQTLKDGVEVLDKLGTGLRKFGGFFLVSRLGVGAAPVPARSPSLRSISLPNRPPMRAPASIRQQPASHVVACFS